MHPLVQFLQHMFGSQHPTVASNAYADQQPGQNDGALPPAMVDNGSGHQVPYASTLQPHPNVIIGLLQAALGDHSQQHPQSYTQLTPGSAPVHWSPKNSLSQWPMPNTAATPQLGALGNQYNQQLYQNPLALNDVTRIDPGLFGYSADASFTAPGAPHPIYNQTIPSSMGLGAIPTMSNAYRNMR